MSTSTTTFYNGILCFGAFLSSDEIAIYDKWTYKQMPNGQTEGRTAAKIKKMFRCSFHQNCAPSLVKRSQQLLIYVN